MICVKIVMYIIDPGYKRYVFISSRSHKVFEVKYLLKASGEAGISFIYLFPSFLTQLEPASPFGIETNSRPIYVTVIHIYGC